MNLLFFVKQKTAVEMRISDWSADVCSTDLVATECGGVRLALGCDRVGHLRGVRGRAAPIPTLGLTAPEIFEGAVRHGEIGRAACRERVCQSGEISVVA